MITFDNGEVARLIKRKKQLNGGNIFLFCLLLITALAAAAAIVYSDSHPYISVVMLALFALFLLATVFYNLFFVSKAGRELKRGLCRTIADGFYGHKEILEGEKEIAFSVTYEGTRLTVERRDRSGEITVRPNRVFGGGALSGQRKITVELSPLKKLPSVYSSTGTLIWEFLQAYYCLKAVGYAEDGSGAEIPERVVVSDEMGKTALNLLIIDGGKPCKDFAKNYFVKEGLIRRD